MWYEFVLILELFFISDIVYSFSLPHQQGTHLDVLWAVYTVIFAAIFSSASDLLLKAFCKSPIFFPM